MKIKNLAKDLRSMTFFSLSVYCYLHLKLPYPCIEEITFSTFPSYESLFPRILYLFLHVCKIALKYVKQHISLDTSVYSSVH